MSASARGCWRRAAARCLALGAAIGLLSAACSAAVPQLTEPEMLRADVAAGRLPPVARRVPLAPFISALDAGGQAAPAYGGTLHMLISRARELRMLYVYGYARLVGYDRTFALVPDILESFEVQDNRVFTLRLRRGHRWSDGAPLTAEDFRYYWEEVANHPALSPGGPPADLLVDGKPPEFRVLDSATVQYAWSSPNPDFLSRLAGASPLLLYRPAHYLKQFHEKFAAGQRQQAGGSRRSWAATHNKMDGMYRSDNPDLPTLQPWKNITRPPADRFVAVRNPYYHRVDAAGRQLPYIDRIEMVIADDKLIAVKSGTGEADLQARGIQFGDYTFLKKGEQRNKFHTLLWRSGKGSQLALYPNLNTRDPEWRKLFRDVRFRRALSLAIDRALINQVLYFGLASESNNTVLPDSPLFTRDYQSNWARYDRAAARRLLDELGLKPGADRIRRLPDGRPLQIVVETAGESSEDTDILELIRETWREVGIKLLVKPSQREVLRNRIFSGETMMSVWGGLENGIPNADMSPMALAPTNQEQLQWPMFGQYYESGGKKGQACDIPEAVELLKLLEAWRFAGTRAERERIWHRMLAIHADQQFSIGTVNGVPQPVVVRNSLANVPEKGLYNWDPGAYFGVYRPDTFWFK